MSFETVIQSNIFTALNTFISVPVYDQAPQSVAFPYVTIGEASAVSHDTDSEIVQFVNYTLHVWTRPQSGAGSFGKKEAQLIIGEIFDILHQLKFSEAGYSFTENVRTGTECFVDSDGKTFHGTITFKLNIGKA